MQQDTTNQLVIEKGIIANASSPFKGCKEHFFLYTASLSLHKNPGYLEILDEYRDHIDIMPNRIPHKVKKPYHSLFLTD